MNSILVRSIALVLHALGNFFLLSYLMNYDLTGSWAGFILFILLFLASLGFFIYHLFIFISYIKSRSL